jgi:acyl-CoA synthetase (AMP-forming)/AMP-acid ligase II
MHISIHAQNTPDRAAFIMASTDEVVTFKQLNDYSNQIAQLARARGLQVGDGVAIFMENNAHFSPPFHRA